MSKIIIENVNTKEQKIFEEINAFKEFIIENSEEWNIKNVLKEKVKKRENKKSKSVGNGEGSLFYSETLKCWVFQYYGPSGVRKTVKQKKTETVKHFKDRVAEIKVSLNNNTYIEKRKDSVKTIIENHIEQKFKDGITKGRAYGRDRQTLASIEKCCYNFITKPIQEVTLKDIQISKEEMKKYAQSVIDKMWRLLKKAFNIAASPSVKLITFNLMNDENLKKPLSNKKTKKVKPLKKEERKRLLDVLNYKEYNHKYRNIVMLEWMTGMRIGEVLARSKEDINKEKTILHIHNTLTVDENNKILLGEHTKTYDEKTGVDNGERYFPLKNKEIKSIINEELAKKVTNLYNLLFWDYEKNTFITPSEVNSWVRRINEKYKISKESLHNHRLRHDRITQWKEDNMDEKAIQYLAGHVEGSSITSDIYIDISREYAFEQYNKAK